MQPDNVKKICTIKWDAWWKRRLVLGVFIFENPRPRDRCKIVYRWHVRERSHVYSSGDSHRFLSRFLGDYYFGRIFRTSRDSRSDLITVRSSRVLKTCNFQGNERVVKKSSELRRRFYRGDIDVWVSITLQTYINQKQFLCCICIYLARWIAQW